MPDVFCHRKVVEDEYGHQSITPIQNHGNAGRWMSHLLQGRTLVQSGRKKGIILEQT